MKKTIAAVAALLVFAVLSSAENSNRASFLSAVNDAVRHKIAQRTYENFKMHACFVIIANKEEKNISTNQHSDAVWTAEVAKCSYVHNQGYFTDQVYFGPKRHINATSSFVAVVEQCENEYMSATCFKPKLDPTKQWEDQFSETDDTYIQNKRFCNTRRGRNYAVTNMFYTYKDATSTDQSFANLSEQEQTLIETDLRSLAQQCFPQTDAIEFQVPFNNDNMHMLKEAIEKNPSAQGTHYIKDKYFAARYSSNNIPICWQANTVMADVLNIMPSSRDLNKDIITFSFDAQHMRFPRPKYTLDAENNKKVHLQAMQQAYSDANATPDMKQTAFCGNAYIKQSFYWPLAEKHLNVKNVVPANLKVPGTQGRNERIQIECFHSHTNVTSQQLAWAIATENKICSSKRINWAPHGVDQDPVVLIDAFIAEKNHYCSAGYCTGTKCLTGRSYITQPTIEAGIHLPDYLRYFDDSICTDCTCAHTAYNSQNQNGNPYSSCSTSADGNTEECRNDYATIAAPNGQSCNSVADLHQQKGWYYRPRVMINSNECKQNGFDIPEDYSACAVALKYPDNNTETLRKKDTQNGHYIIDDDTIDKLVTVQSQTQTMTSEICAMGCPYAGHHTPCTADTDDQCLSIFNPGQYLMLHNTEYKCKYCRLGTKATQQQGPANSSAAQQPTCEDINECGMYYNLFEQDICQKLGYNQHTCVNLNGNLLDDTIAFRDIVDASHLKSRYSETDHYHRFMCVAHDGITREIRSAYTFLAPTARDSCKSLQQNLITKASAIPCIEDARETIETLKNAARPMVGNEETCTANHKFDISSKTCLPCPKGTTSHPSPTMPYPTVCLGEIHLKTDKKKSFAGGNGGLEFGLIVGVVFVIIIVVVIAQTIRRAKNKKPNDNTPLVQDQSLNRF